MRVKIKIRSKEEAEWLMRMSEGLQVLVDRILAEREREKEKLERAKEQEREMGEELLKKSK